MYIYIYIFIYIYIHICANIYIDLTKPQTATQGTDFAEGAIDLRVFAGSDLVYFTNGTYTPTACEATPHCSIAFYAIITSVIPKA